MSRVYTVEELVAVVPGLSRARLARFEACEVVIPAAAGEAAHYRDIDRARLDLACRLGDAYALDEEALALVMDLVDRLHSTRARLDTLMQAVAVQPDPVRRSIIEAMAAARTDARR